MAALTPDHLLEAFEQDDRPRALRIHQEVRGPLRRHRRRAVAVAAAPAAGGGAAASRRGAQERASSPTCQIGPYKIPVIKVVRELTGLGLKEAQDFVHASPKPVKEGVARDEAEKIKAALEEQGAKVEDQVATSPRATRTHEEPVPRWRGRLSRFRVPMTESTDPSRSLRSR